MDMPPKGFKAVTIRQDLYQRLEQLAKQKDVSVASLVRVATELYLAEESQP